MLNVTVIAVGKLKERYLTDACAEYEKRLGAYCRLRDSKLPELKEITPGHTCACHRYD